METIQKVNSKSILIILLLIFQSCRTATCEEEIKHNSNFEVKLVVTEIYSNGNIIDIDGISITNKKPINFYYNSGWFRDIGDKFQVGDTLMKENGLPTIKVYRKNERWSFTYKCEKNAQGEDIVSSENIRF